MRTLKPALEEDVGGCMFAAKILRWRNHISAYLPSLERHKGVEDGLRRALTWCSGRELSSSTYLLGKTRIGLSVLWTLNAESLYYNIADSLGILIPHSDRPSSNYF